MATDNHMAGQMEQQEQPSPASSQDRSKSASNNQSQSLAGSSGVPNAGIASFRRYVIHIYTLPCCVVFPFICYSLREDIFSLDM